MTVLTENPTTNSSDTSRINGYKSYIIRVGHIDSTTEESTKISTKITGDFRAINEYVSPVYYSISLLPPNAFEAIRKFAETENNTVQIIPYYKYGDILTYLSLLRTDTLESLNHKANLIYQFFHEITQIILDFKSINCWITDIKGPNLLLNELDNYNPLLLEQLEIKIADTKSIIQCMPSTRVGHRTIEKNNTIKLQHSTPAYESPEIKIEYGSTTIENYTTYTLGMTLYELLTNTLPDNIEFSADIFRTSAGNILKTFIKMMLEPNPDNRISLKELKFIRNKIKHHAQSFHESEMSKLPSIDKLFPPTRKEKKLADISKLPSVHTLFSSTKKEKMRDSDSEFDTSSLSNTQSLKDSLQDSQTSASAEDPKFIQ